MTAPPAPPDTTHLLYLHGFRSSPQSMKARKMAARVAQNFPVVHWCCPQLPPSPAAAMALVRQAVAGWPRERMAVVGSSLGGFYATVLAEATGCRAVLLNPAVEPARDLARHIGEHSAWHDPAERFFFEPRFVDELRALRPAAITSPQRYYAVIAEGDEVLDAREMAARYAGCGGVWVPGSDHALSNFDALLPGVLDFLRLVQG